jgi:prophage regulatory protein
MSNPSTDPGRLLSPKDVERQTSLSRTTLWRKVKEGSFPKPLKISANRIAWSSSDLEQWQASCSEAA